jgi:hypothetical protein
VGLIIAVLALPLAVLLSSGVIDVGDAIRGVESKQ